eukprot:1847789-Amphidinium_carterae.1
MMGSSLLAINSVSLGPLLSLKSLAQLGLAAFVSDSAHFGPPLLAHGLVKYGSTQRVYNRLQFTDDTTYIDGSGAPARSLHI